jgi:dCMP deaminase
MDFAMSLSKISKCTQRGVAAIITDETLAQVYSIGINGGPAGGVDCLCALPGKETCIHAEAQAIAKSTSADKRKVMFSTLSPCVTCASMIVNTGFIAVYVDEVWKDTTGLAILQSAGIKVYKANEKGKWLPWVSK